MVAVRCLKPGCDRQWPRDPVLEIACPTCGVGAGVKCRRPSGHGAWQNWCHAARDVQADRLGHYGDCPLGLCGRPMGRLFPQSTSLQTEGASS